MKEILKLILLTYSLKAIAQDCWVQSANKYHISKLILYAIAKQESQFNPKALNKKNKNKSIDYGLMQINSVWLEELKKYGIKKKISMILAPVLK